MDLVKWKPFDELRKLKSEMDSFFPSSFGLRDFGVDFAVDVIEGDVDTIVRAEIPGVTKKDISVDYNDGVLTIKAEKKEEKEEGDKTFSRIETSYGMMSRSLRIPGKVDTDNIKAEYKNGVVKIILPKIESEQTKKIAVE